MKRITVLASGGGTNFQAVVDGCRSGYIDGEVSLLVYNRRDAYARERAGQAGVPAHYINRIAEGSVEAMQRKVHELLCSSGIDIIVLAGYLEKLGADTVAKWSGRIVNTHPSLIPKFCGQGYFGHHVHSAVLAAGEKESGCTIHLVDENYDTGPVVFRQKVPVLPDDTPETLAARILPVEHELLQKTVKLLCEDRIAVSDGKAVFLD